MKVLLSAGGPEASVTSCGVNITVGMIPRISPSPESFFPLTAALILPPRSSPISIRIRTSISLWHINRAKRYSPPNAIISSLLLVLKERPKEKRCIASSILVLPWAFLPLMTLNVPEKVSDALSMLRKLVRSSACMINPAHHTPLA